MAKCLPLFGGTEGKNHFSGFSSLLFFLRGWGGVFSIRRKTASGLRGGSSFLSGFIGKPSQKPFFEDTIIDENDLDKRVLPWECDRECDLEEESDEAFSWQPHKLVSLWDMIRIKISVLCNLMERLQQMELEGEAHFRHMDSLEIPVPRLRSLTPEAIELLQREFTKFQNDFEQIEFPGGIVEKLQYILNSLNTTSPERLHENIKSLRYLIKKELTKQSFLFMPQDDAKWYKKEDLFGPEVSNKFRDAVRDIKEAGNCYATGLDTACVFHLMRVAEYGLRALARERGVKWESKLLEYAQWGAIIAGIEKKVEPLEQARAGPEKDAALQFYRGALGDLRAFKDIYRNPVTHPRYIYEKHEALKALDHVAGFMKRLSLRISEKPKSIKWKL
jgi:hypothetical protein